MKSTPQTRFGWTQTAAVLLLVFLWPLVSNSQEDASKGSDTTKPLSSDQLEQLVAPIALYPDSLLAQVLMASTYPLEVVEAARWVKANPKVEGKALEDAMQKQDWDPSVKSLTAFPQTLAMLNDKLSWTTQLGDAFLAQQKDVMNAAQVLRQKAKAAGNLESNEQQKVTVEDKPAGDQTQTIIIQPANPQVVYVPTYNPTVIYGPWPYPAYPPFYWYPPGYVAATSMISFGVGMAVGAAMWGGCNWGHSSVNININRYNRFNRTTINNVNWKHDNRHRRGVSYGNRDLQKRFGGRQARDAQAREAFRGRAADGRQKIARGDADRFKAGNSGNRMGGAADRIGTGNRDGASRAREIGQKRGGGDGRLSGRRDSAFEGMGNGRSARRYSDRGLSSRSGRFGGGGGGGRRFGGGRRR